jgi:hypothetical protein
MALAVLVALGLVVSAQALGATANHARGKWPKSVDRPFAPSAGSAPYVSLGYRELGADLLWIRALGYFGGDDHPAAGTRALIEAIVALDPRFERVYAWGGIAITSVGSDATNEDRLAAIRVLERGMKEFPDNYRLPLYAGQIYTGDLESKDPAQVEAWQLEGARYLERAVRTPGAPKAVGAFVAHLRSKLGQRDKAIRDLRELILYTKSAEERDKLVKKLAELEDRDKEGLLYELEVEQKRFEAEWQARRPEVPPSMYLFLGAPLAPAFDLEDLAVDRDLVGTEAPIEPLPPVPD